MRATSRFYLCPHAPGVVLQSRDSAQRKAPPRRGWSLGLEVPIFAVGECEHNGETTSAKHKNPNVALPPQDRPRAEQFQTVGFVLPNFFFDLPLSSRNRSMRKIANKQAKTRDRLQRQSGAFKGRVCAPVGDCRVVDVARPHGRESQAKK
jgi:hypothetical protein